MADLITRVVLLLVLVGMIGTIGWVTFKALINGGIPGGLRRALGGEPDYVLEHQGRDLVRFRAEATATRPAVVVRERASTNSRGYRSREWEVEVGGLEQLAARTTVFIGLDGLTGALRNRHGIVDVKVGDRAFDRRFKVGGSDEDVIRGVFAHAEVREAVAGLFKRVTVLDCTLERDSLVVTFLPDHVRGKTGRQRIALVVRLADTLRMASVSSAIKHPAQPVPSASPSSGAPVGVRTL